MLAIALTLVGAPGTFGRVTEFDALDEALVPAALVAVMVNVYVAPGVNPVTVIGLTVEVALNPPTLEAAV